MKSGKRKTGMNSSAWDWVLSSSKRSERQSTVSGKTHACINYPLAHPISGAQLSTDFRM